MGEKKTVQSNEPWAPAAPYILQGLQNSGRVFDQTQPQLEGYAANQRATYGRVAPGAEAGITAAQSRVNNVLSGGQAGMNPGRAAYLAAMTPRATNNYTGAVQPSLDYYKKVMGGGFLNSNPYLDSSIGYAIDDANNAANSAFSGAGRYGSGAHQSVLAREAGRISSNARSAAYENERGRMGDAAANYGSMGLQALGADEQARASAQQDSLSAAQMADQGYNLDQSRQDQAVGQSQDLMRGSQSVLDSAAQLPWYGVGALNGNVRTASNGYGTTTQTQSGDLLGGIAGLAGTLGGAAIKAGVFGSDKRIKNDAGVVGKDPRTGLALHAYTYKGDPEQTPQVGVMAQDVKKVAPDAVLKDPASGLMAVDYGKLGLPDPDALAAQLPMQRPDKVRSRTGQILHNAFSADSSSNIGDSLSRVGEGLLANAGGGWSGIGMALMQGRQDRQQQAQADRNYGLETAKLGLMQQRYAEDPVDDYQISTVPGVGAVRINRRTGKSEVVQAEQARPAAAASKQLKMVPGVGLVEYDPATGKSAVVQRAAPRPAAGGGAAPRVGMSGGIPVITSPQQFAALPSGATFKAPDGTVRRKP